MPKLFDNISESFQNPTSFLINNSHLILGHRSFVVDKEVKVSRTVNKSVVECCHLMGYSAVQLVC
jgi:hypothetical protein